MKRTISLIMAMAVGSALAADVTYTEPPADTSMIRVSGGTTTVAGRDVGANLTHYWSFDDAENYLTGDSGGLTFGKLPKSMTITHELAEGAKMGAGAVTVTAGLQVPKNVITGQTFTVAFWLRPNANSKVSSQGSIFYVGEEGTSAVSDEKRLLLGYSNGNGSMFFWMTGNSKVNFAHTTTAGVWEHWAITRDTGKAVKVYLNGVCQLTKTYDIVFGENDNLVFGNGWHYDGGTKAIGGGTFDEIRIFDRALTADELKAVAVCGVPPDFSAGWDIEADGTLDLQGREPFTALKGEGVAKTVETTRLEASSNAWFAGTVQSPAFAFAGESAVTQTLSGANAWTGATTVESGTLEIAASPVGAFGDALVAWYPFEDATKPGRDFSPRGNHLTPHDDCIYEVTAAAKPFADAGQNLSVSNEVQAGFRFAGIMDGFTAGQDNSFTVSFWMRGDAHSKDVGSFYFANGQGSGIICREETGLRIGDSGGATTVNMSEKWASGNWHHWVLIYDAEAARQIDGGATEIYCYYLFIDGECEKKSSTRNIEVKHATGAFYIARGFGSSGGPFKGAMDEVVVLNTGNTNDVAKLYALRRTQPEAATGVLPTGTVVTVEEGATLKLTGANETVAKLYGKGTIDLSNSSKLTVTTKDRFKGTVIGGTITDAPGAEPQGMFLLAR